MAAWPCSRDAEKECDYFMSHSHTKPCRFLKNGLVYEWESGIVRNLGFDIFTNHDFRQDAYLFGESQSRVVVTVSPDNKEQFEKFLQDKISFTLLGEVTDGKIIIDDLDFGSINKVKEDYLSAIENILES